MTIEHERLICAFYHRRRFFMPVYICVPSLFVICRQTKIIFDSTKRQFFQFLSAKL